jgi:hypothetical protein
MGRLFLAEFPRPGSSAVAKDCAFLAQTDTRSLVSNRRETMVRNPLIRIKIRRFFARENLPLPFDLIRKSCAVVCIGEAA